MTHNWNPWVSGVVVFTTSSQKRTPSIDWVDISLNLKNFHDSIINDVSRESLSDATHMEPSARWYSFDNIRGKQEENYPF